MSYQVTLSGALVNYILHRSRRARYLRIRIDTEGGLIVTLPWRMSDHQIEPFLQEKAGWILKHLAKTKIQEWKKLPVTHEEFQKNKLQVLKLFTGRVNFFNQFYRFSFNKIRLRNQKTIWGSCTRSGNLQFNYKLTLLPGRMLDYVVVHELCHLKEHNHGVKFWQLVAQVFPDYKPLRKSLRGYII